MPYGAHGSLSGSGNLVFDTVLAKRITVDALNTYSGTTLIKRGWVQMGTTDGQTYLLGPITIGGSSAGKLGWGANNQVDNNSNITLALSGSSLDGTNATDAKIETYCEITRKVAKSTHVILVDLRRAYIAYLQNHNAQLRVDGTLHSERRAF